MIKYINGDIFDSPAQVIVNTVNTVGVMGKGLALAFKQRYPEMFDRYKTVCEKNLLTVGKLMLFYEADHWILLFPTKTDWRKPSQLSYIESGLRKFVQTYAEKNISSIAFPCLGCGNGGLDWNEVKPMMESYLNDLPIDVYVYLSGAPSTPPEHEIPVKTVEWLKANAKDMSFNGVRDDLIFNCSVFPYQFVLDGRKYEMTYHDQRLEIFPSDEKDKSIQTDERDLYQIWDYIRSKTVFSINNSTEAEKLIYGLLFSLGYLSKIQLLNHKSGRMENGYQINMGLDRVLAFAEV